jgi:succinoglycan biosynthesis transport protein ExoP
MLTRGQKAIVPVAEANLNKTLDHARRVITRYRWWILLTTAATIFATMIVLSLIPSRYSSEATLLVVQQQVPERYVVPTSTTSIREALRATTEEVLSRTRLQQIIEEFGLYPKERRRFSPEALLELMRRDIEIEPLDSLSDRKDVSSFKISFIASNPQLAQAVTSKLTSLFIEQDIETREHQATTTTQFLREQLEATKAKLTDAEDQVRGFKMQHLGELPEQESGNLAIMNGLQSQLQNTMASRSRAEEQRQYLEALSESRTLTISGDLVHLKSERAKLLDRYTPQYPAVLKLSEKIAETEALLNGLQMSRRSGESQPAPALGSPRAAVIAGEDISLGQLQGQLESNRLEIENLSKDERRLKRELDQYQTRLNATPVREQQLAGILRNYDQLKLDYTELLAKESQSQMAADLEKRQEGQQFRLVDRPSLPTVPTSPNRFKISFGSVAAGLGLGLALAFLLDTMDRSFHSEEEVSQRFSVPLVIGVPLLLTVQEERSQARKKAFEWVAGSGLILAVLIAQLYEFYLYQHG